MCAGFIILFQFLKFGSLVEDCAKTSGPELLDSEAKLLMHSGEQELFHEEVVGIGKAFSTEQKAEHMYWLAWKCVANSGAVVKPFEGWLETVVDVQMVEEPARP